MDAGPVDRGIRRTDLARKFAGKDSVLRDQLMFEICLIGNGVAGSRIDKHDWTIQSQAPGLAAVTIRSLLELPKILCSQFGIDARRLCRRARNKYEQAQDHQAESSIHFTDTTSHLTMPQE